VKEQLPDWLQVLLASCPHTGEGVHHWLFRVTRQLHWHMGIEEMANLLESATVNCGRVVTRREILDAIQNSSSCAWTPCGNWSTGAYSTPKWPEVNQEQRDAIIAPGFGLVDLWESSSSRIDDSGTHTEEIIDALFPNNPLLCCGESEKIFDTRPREEWRVGLSKLQFIVPSPMSARLGRKKNPQPGESQWSAHTLDNTGPRRFLVVEFDQGDVDDHAALLWHLAETAPLALAVHSGSKSIHGWFYCLGQPEEKLRCFMRYAVSLGACTSTWCRSQFVRMPDGLRDNGKRQAVYYFNPGVIK
jgi:hypothetical protein